MEKHEEHKEKKPNHQLQHKKTKVLSDSFYAKVYVVLGVALVLSGVYNVSQSSSLNSIFDKNLAEAKEAARPAELGLITIVNSECTDCFDISPIIGLIRDANVKIIQEKTLEINSIKAKELINKYNIEKIPAVIVIGEIDKPNLKDLEKKDDVLLFTQLTLPYTDAKTSVVLGRVSATIIKDSDCGKCVDLRQMLAALKQAGVTIVSENVIERGTSESDELIDEYSLQVLPALIFSKDLGDYGTSLTAGWDSVGSVEKDGSYVIRTTTPPYLNLTTNQVEGLVSITYLVDGSCEKCYGAEAFHKPILQRMGVVTEKENNVDISSPEGKDLISNYNIEKVPTMILTGDMEKYPYLVGAWKDVGTVESNGAYVFRRVEIAQQPYKGLEKNEVVTPEIQPPQQ